MPLGCVLWGRSWGPFALAVLFAVGLPLAGCHDSGDVTGSVARVNAEPASSEAEQRADADELGKQYDAHPGEKDISIAYSKTLRALKRYEEAAAVMQAAAVKAPNDFDVLGEYGRALADDGQLVQARDVLSHAYAPDRPDWRILSAQGTVADRLDDHEGAQSFYREALAIAPGEPDVLSNLGLSYALSKKLPQAEAALRQAAADPRADVKVRSNLALVLALEGKFAEAEKVSERDLSPQAAAANVESIKRMIAQTPTWRDLETAKPSKQAKPPIDAPPDDAPPAQTDSAG